MTRRHHRRPARPVAGLVACIAVVVGGCGVRPDPAPRAIAHEVVPYNLLEQAPPSPPRPQASPSLTSIAVYFLASDRLQPAPRQISGAATPRRVLDSLLIDVPDEEEATAGLRTAIAPGTTLSVGPVEDGVVVVGLTARFVQQTSRQEQVTALAQIVFTLTELPDVAGVRFTLDGLPVDVPTADGAVTADPVDRGAFPGLAPRLSTGAPTPE